MLSALSSLVPPEVVTTTSLQAVVPTSDDKIGIMITPHFKIMKHLLNMSSGGFMLRVGLYVW